MAALRSTESGGARVAPEEPARTVRVQRQQAAGVAVREVAAHPPRQKEATAMATVVTATLPVTVTASAMTTAVSWLARSRLRSRIAGVGPPQSSTA